MPRTYFSLAQAVFIFIYRYDFEWEPNHAIIRSVIVHFGIDSFLPTEAEYMFWFFIVLIFKL